MKLGDSWCVDYDQDSRCSVLENDFDSIGSIHPYCFIKRSCSRAWMISEEVRSFYRAHEWVKQAKEKVFDFARVHFYLFHISGIVPAGFGSQLLSVSQSTSTQAILISFSSWNET